MPRGDMKVNNEESHRHLRNNGINEACIDPNKKCKGPHFMLEHLGVRIVFWLCTMTIICGVIVTHTECMSELSVIHNALSSYYPLRSNTNTVEYTKSKDENDLMKPPAITQLLEKGEAHYAITQPLQKDETREARIPRIQPQRLKTDGKLHALIHVGPHKMGSTFMQRAVFLAKDFLQRDQYILPAVEDMPRPHDTNVGYMKLHMTLALCLTHIWPCADNFFTVFRDFLKRTASNRKNIIITSEELDKPEINIKELGQLMAPWKENTRIVVTYRRFYEWLMSLYFEFHRPTSGFRVKGKPYASFVQWCTLDKIKEMRDSMYTSAVAERYREHFSDIYILNFHDKSRKGPVPFLFCDALVNAPNTCAHANDLGGDTITNKAFDLEYERLINNARAAGLLRPDATNAYVEDMFLLQLRGLKRSEADLPRACLSDEIQKELLRITLEAEEKYLGVKWFQSERGERDLRANFEQTVMTGKFCSLDVDAILKDEMWVNLFRLF